jgi:hypothetical protein
MIDILVGILQICATLMMMAVTALIVYGVYKIIRGGK